MQNREYREHYHLKRHMSYSEKPSPVDVVQPGQPASKSENEIIFPYDLANLKKSTANLNKPRRLDAGDRESEQYYKRYNHKQVPVKDSSGKLENINLTESKLNIIETKAMKGITEPTLPKTVSMDSNIQIIKTAVQEILNNFFVNMEVFEDHKRRFNDLLMKDPHTSAAGMEEFIKEIIKRILSQSSVSNNSYKSLEGNSSIQDKHGDVTTNTLSSVNRVHNSQTRDDGPSDFTAISALNSKSLKKSIDSTIDFFKLFIGSEESENYSKSEVLWSAERLKNRQVASAGDISTFLTEKLQIEGFLLQQNKSTIKESEIPVRSARPAMYLNINEVDELSQREFSRKVTSNRVIDREDRKSVVSKICGFFCRKLRRYSTA